MNVLNNSKLRGLKATASIYLIAGFIAIQALAFSETAFGTWNVVYQFPAADGYVSASYFFNPLVGIIGFHWNITSSTSGMVKRTTDGGKSWTDCTVPLLTNKAPQVSDIWFSDSVNGWLTWFGGLSGDPMLWRTTDGGKTWTITGFTMPPSITGPTSVRQTPSALTVTEGLGVGLWTSIDTGKTWVMHNDRKSGLDFGTDVNGVATEWGENSTTTFLYTADGGLNWYNAPGGLQHNAWGVYAIKHAQTFVIAQQDTTIRGAFQLSHVYRSTDNGRYWTTITQLPINTTGAIQGVEGIIYVQNSAGIAGTPQGLFRSMDSGLTWASVGGPNQGGDPYPVNITRFSVTSCGDVVYASDDMGGLWKSIDAGDGMVPGQCEFVDKDTLAPIQTTVCDTIRHTFYLHNPNISTIVLQGISIFDTTRRPVTTSSVYIDSFPDPYTSIIPGDSLAFGLAWHPGALEDSTGSDSVTIRVIFYASYLAQFPESGLVPYDTLYLRVKLSGISNLAEFAVIPKSVQTPTLVICNSVDTVIKMVNLGCDSLRINSAALLKKNWTLSTSGASGPITLPFYLHHDDTLYMRVQATPVSSTVLSDSLQLKMHYMGADTSFGVGLRTSAKPGLSLTAPQTLQFDSVATCISTTQIISLPNVGCDTVTITQADLTDSHFELLDTNGVPLKPPVIILPNSTLNVKVRFTPITLGGKSATLSFHSQYFGIDSIHSIALSGIGSASGTVTFPTTLNFNNVSICGSADSSITIANKTCLTIFVDSLVVPSPFVSLDASKLPLAIDTGSVDSLRIRYKPGSKQTETAQIYLKLNINNGATQIWDTLTFLGTGVSGASALQTTPPITNSLLNFDTLSTCGTGDSISFKVYNPSCDTTVFTGLSLDAGISGTFQAIANQALPAKLAGNDSLTVTVAVTSLVANTYAGNLHLQYTLSDGTAHDLPAPVALTVKSGGGSSVLSLGSPTTLDFNTIHACTAADTTITFSNKGCVADTVWFNITGIGFVLGSGPDSIIIPAGATGSVHVDYDGSTPNALSSNVTLTSTAATGSKFTITVKGNVPPPGAVVFNLSFSGMPVSPGGFFNVYLTPDRAVSGAGLNEIHGVLECPLNSFEYYGEATYSGAPVTIIQNRFGTTAHYTFDITGTNISLDPATPILTFPMMAMVSDTDGGMIWADSISLNGGDPTFGTCDLSANTSIAGLNTTIANQCGDSVLVLVLRDKPLFSSERLRPNPVTQESRYKTTLNLVSAEDGMADIELFDALGQMVSRGQISLLHGQAQDYTFDLHDLTSGSYYYSLLFNGQTAAGNLRGTLLLVK